ncbi:hypothetical protein CO540_27350 [Micromonospora sp. WMMA2032]|uniref:HD domain-containing protein n=1 Tax=Micromonospora sp. WMMA2032 TaxID=2039870 RepID=UPI000C058F62|nr:ATP-binding protein [Micromonospora sp. WMMA2032]ATO18114.1 hypothetical protein CO540_27350 [Micromonospora sp. WMMA2032]
MTHAFERTPLWQLTLGREAGEYERECETLRHAYMQFRDTVEPLASEISQSMPMFTDHSINHIDALWDVASIICGDDFEMNPAEAFVLGGAFLLHDLGMGLVAYPGGIDEVKQDALFDDLHYAAVARLTNDLPNATGAAVTEIALDETVAAILRLRHAKRAERLVGEFFQLPNRQGFYLLQDAQLRQAYGPLIGRIAHSHWWEVENLPKQFGQVMGSLADYPADWHIDPLKIACILRLADAAHIDSRRAPTFLHAFRNPIGPSRDHWDFQQRLMRPRRVGDRLEYTSSVQFRKDEAGAWWLAYETIRMIDSELRKVDALCADLGRQRFAARSVAGADTPSRLANYIPTDQWEPVDARLRVSNVPHLVATLGGSALYGQNRLAAIRELAANAADATRVRQVMHGGSDSVVKIRLRQEEDAGGNPSFWLEVTDQGIGMDAATLVAALTDFGRSNWQSNDMIARYPRLLAKGFRSTGRFGIGFYAIFMVADEVSVTSLRWFDQPENTHVLEFKSGLQTRPLLRRAEEDEHLQFGGTVVRARLRAHPLQKDEGILWSYSWPDQEDPQVDSSLSLNELLRSRMRTMCALADVDIEVQGPTEATPVRIIRANDWKFIKAGELFDRLVDPRSNFRAREGDDTYLYWRSNFERHAANLTDASGEIVGRIMLDVDGRELPDEVGAFVWYPPSCTIYVGGLEADELTHFIGVVVGEPLKADRSAARTLAELPDFERWVQSQMDHLESCSATSIGALSGAAVARYLNQAVPKMPCGFTADGNLPLEKLATWAKSKHELILLGQGTMLCFNKTDGGKRFINFQDGEEIDMPDNVLLLEFSTDYLIPEIDRPEPETDEILQLMAKPGSPYRRVWPGTGISSTPRYVIRAIAEAWAVPAEDLDVQLLAWDRDSEADNRFILTTRQGKKSAHFGLRIRKPHAAQASEVTS